MRKRAVLRVSLEYMERLGKRVDQGGMRKRTVRHYQSLWWCICWQSHRDNAITLCTWLKSLTDPISTFKIHEIDLMMLGKLSLLLHICPSRWSRSTGRKYLQEIPLHCHFWMKSHRPQRPPVVENSMKNGCKTEYKWALRVIILVWSMMIHSIIQKINHQAPIKYKTSLWGKYLGSHQNSGY